MFILSTMELGGTYDSSVYRADIQYCFVDAADVDNGRDGGVGGRGG